VNGKLRSKFSVETDTDEGTIKQIALADERLKKFIDGRTIKKVIYVKGKLVNIVV
jgi:leucyl-tRNA synthetase